MNPALPLKIKLVAKALRDIAASLEVASNPSTIREGVAALEDAQMLLMMTLYKWGCDIVQNAAHDFDKNEGLGR